jgi:hypothetical protein
MLGLFRYAVKYQKSAVTFALSFFYLAGTAQATTLVVGDMTEVDWAAISVNNTNLVTEVKAVVASGGNAGSHLQLGVSKSGYDSPIESDGNQYTPGAGLAMIYQAAVWNPATDGVLTSLNISFDATRLESSYTNNSGGLLTAAVEQNGRIYYLWDSMVSITNSQWQSFSFSSVDSSKWLNLNADFVTQGFFSTAQPDFSSGMLRFGVGYVAYNQCYVSCDGFNGKVAVDNLSVSVNGMAPSVISPVPAPTAVWLFATGLPVLGAVVRRRTRPV